VNEQARPVNPGSVKALRLYRAGEFETGGLTVDHSADLYISLKIIISPQYSTYFSMVFV
jgi:hypothetical protein